jgi:WD40 repeat protein
VLTATVAARPDQAEERAYRRGWVLLLILVAFIAFLVLMVLCVTRETQVCQLRYTQDGRTLAVSVNTLDNTAEVRLLDAPTGRLRASWPLGNRLSCRPHHRVAFAPDGRTLAVATCERHQDGRCLGEVALWDLSQGTERARLRAHTGRIVAVAFSGDGRTLLSADNEGTIIVWDSATARAMKSLHLLGGCACFAVSADGRLVAAGQADGTVTLVEVPSGRELEKLAASVYPIASVAFAPDGRTLAVAALFDTHLVVWEPAAGKVRTTATLPVSWQTCVAFSPAGKSVAVGGGSFGRPGQVTVFRSDTLVEVRTLPVHTNTVTALAFAPDGSTLAAGSGRSARWPDGPSHGAVHRWDLATGRPLPGDE